MHEILTKLRKHKIGIKVVNNQLQLNVPKDVNARPILELVKTNKQELISYLQKINNAVEKENTLHYEFDKKDFETYHVEKGQKYYDLFYQQEKEYLRFKVIGEFAFNIAFSMDFESIDLTIIEKTLRTIFERHESLRTQFRIIDGVPKQHIVDNYQLPMAYFDLRESEDNDALYAKRIESALGKSFDMENELSAYATLIQKSNNRTTLLFVINHANSDYSSIAILKREISEMYSAFLSNKENPLPELKAQYRHYGLWTNNLLNSEEGRRVRDRYIGKIKTSISKSNEENLASFLNTNHTGYRAHLQKELNSFSFEKKNVIEKYAFGKLVNLIPGKGAKYSIKLDNKVVQELHEVASRYKVSSFIVLLSTFVLTFNRFSHKKQARIFIPFSTRVTEDFETVVGYLTNIVVLCLEITPSFSLEQFIKYVASEFFKSSEYRLYPYEELLNDLDVSLEMLAPMYINYIKYTGQISDIFKQGHQEEEGCHFNNGMTISEYENNIYMEVRYNVNTYSKEDIERFVSLFKDTLKNICESETSNKLVAK